MSVSAVTTAEVLIVEDDAVILNTLAYNLTRQGFGVQKAMSGAEALKLARQLRPDLILLDVMLPGESGIRVCEKIREEDREVVIVMITAKDAEEDKVQGFEAGDLWLDTKNFTARVKGEALNLRLKEFELLVALALQPGELKSREELAKEVWGHAGVGSSRTIDVHIRRIRASLSKSDYEYVHTARGLGYRFEPRPKSEDVRSVEDRAPVETRE